MNKTLPLCVAAFMIWAVVPTMAEEASPKTTAAAEALLEAMGGIEQARGSMALLQDAIVKDIRRREPSMGDAATAFMERELAPNSDRVVAYLADVKTAAVSFYSENFTAEEMEQIVAFQKSEAGRKFQSKTPDLMQTIGPKFVDFQKKLISDMQGKKPADAP